MERCMITETVQRFSWLIDGVNKDKDDALKEPFRRAPRPTSLLPWQVFTADLKFGLAREPCRPEDIKGFLFEDLDGFANFILSIQARFTLTTNRGAVTPVTPNDAVSRPSTTARSTSTATPRSP